MKNEKEKPALIKCRVLPNNQYGYDKAGSIVEVEAKEYARAKHCLISLEDEKKLAEFVPPTALKTEQARTEMQGYREMFRQQHEQRKQAELKRLEQQAREVAEHAKLLKE